MDHLGEEDEEEEEEAEEAEEDMPDDASDVSDATRERQEAYFAKETTETPVAATFASLQLNRALLRGLAALNFSKPTPIQARTIPIALAGKDIVAGAVTGSGKTAAF